MTRDGIFPSTCWSQVRDGAGDSAHAQSALERLALLYWKPIQSYLVASGRTQDDAEELTQDFFSWIIETGFLKRAESDRGRFRGFIKVALRNYVIDRDREKNAKKRGGDIVHHSIDGERVPLPTTAVTPEQSLDEAWKSEVTRQGLLRLEEELRRSNRGKMFDVFRAYFLDPGENTDYQAIADQFQITKVDVSNYLARAKNAYRQHLKALVLETVHTAEELEEEWSWLFGKDLS